MDTSRVSFDAVSICSLRRFLATCLGCSGGTLSERTYGGPHPSGVSSFGCRVCNIISILLSFSGDHETLPFLGSSLEDVPNQ